MFKKIEIWILYLVVLLGIPITISFGGLVRQELVGRTKLGWISKTALFFAEMPVNLKKIQEKPSLPYLIKEDRFPQLNSFNGTPNLNQSYLLLSRYDGDMQEGIVELVDLKNFNIVHSWNPDIDEFNKSVDKVNEFKYINRDSNNARQILLHPYITTEGGLLFNIWGGPLIRKIDKCSNLLFQNTEDQSSHSIEIDSDGNIWTPSDIYPQTLLSKKVGRELPNTGGFKDNAIVKLSPKGNIIFKKSVAQIFIDNGLEYLLFSVGDRKFNYDPIHINDIQPVNFDGEYWKKGDVFLSLRHQSMILLYRPSENKIIWKATGPFFHQHDVNILNNHQISIFNNNSKNFINGDVVDGNNEVIIYNFKSNKYSYYLNASLIKNDVRTITQGRGKIISNGDLFIEEQNSGRILYFNSDGSLRWTYVNRANNKNIYNLGWSRILFENKDINIINNFLKSKGTCND